MHGRPVPSGRLAIASSPRIDRSSFKVLAIGHSSCAIARPSGQYKRQVTIAADFRGATRELDCGLTKECDSTICVGRVDRRGQRIEQLAKIPTSVAGVDLRLLRLPLVSLFHPLAPRQVGAAFNLPLKFWITLISISI